VCALAMELPEVQEGTSFGTPALHVRRKFLARLKEDGKTVAIRVDFLDRDVLLQLDPKAFFLTDHYRPYPAMLVRLEEARPELMKRLLEEAWRRQAPRSLVAGWSPQKDHVPEPARPPRISRPSQRAVDRAEEVARRYSGRKKAAKKS
jgi:hypothetical protein